MFKWNAGIVCGGVKGRRDGLPDKKPRRQPVGKEVPGRRECAYEKSRIGLRS